MEADDRLCCAHRCEQRADAEDVHVGVEVLGQLVKGHLGADPFQRLHLEVRIAHPVFDGSKWMLDRFAPLAHLRRMLVEPLLDGLPRKPTLPPRNDLRSEQLCGQS